MISRITSIAEGTKQKILTGVGHPTGAVLVVISQIVQVLRIASKQRGRGDECNHCFACGDSGHVARECYRNKNRGSQQGNG